MDLGAGLFTQQKMKWGGLFLIGDDERSGQLRGFRLRQLATTITTAADAQEPSDAAPTVPKSLARALAVTGTTTTQHTESGVYSLVGKRGLRAGTRWTATAFADGHFSADTSALVCGVYTTHANPTLCSYPKTFS